METNSDYPANQQPPEETTNSQYQDALDNYLKVEDLKKQVEDLNKKSFIDSLTGCYNRNAWQDYQVHFDLNRDHLVTLVVVDVNNLKKTNDTDGHDAGDKLITQTAQYLKEVFSRKEDRVFRIGGDEFVVACEYVTPDKREGFNTYLNKQLNRQTLAQKGLNFALGVSHSDPTEDISIKETLKRADLAMYQDKKR